MFKEGVKALLPSLSKSMLLASTVKMDYIALVYYLGIDSKVY